MSLIMGVREKMHEGNIQEVVQGAMRVRNYEDRALQKACLVHIPVPRLFEKAKEYVRKERNNPKLKMAFDNMTPSKLYMCPKTIHFPIELGFPVYLGSCIVWGSMYIVWGPSL